MASLINGYIESKKLKSMDQAKLINGKKGIRIPITIQIKEESRFGNNADIFIQQSQEERENKVPRHYIGNAKVVWTDGVITKAEKDDSNFQGSSNQSSSSIESPFPIADNVSEEDDDDLPF